MIRTVCLMGSNSTKQQYYKIAMIKARHQQDINTSNVGHTSVLTAQTSTIPFCVLLPLHPFCVSPLLAPSVSLLLPLSYEPPPSLPQYCPNKYTKTCNWRNSIIDTFVVICSQPHMLLLRLACMPGLRNTPPASPWPQWQLTAALLPF